jgi:hypothetical protein
MQRRYLALADQHVAELQKIIAAERIKIANMQRQGLKISRAQSKLAILFISLARFNEQRESLLRAMRNTEKSIG